MKSESKAEDLRPLSADLKEGLYHLEQAKRYIAENVPADDPVQLSFAAVFMRAIEALDDLSDCLGYKDLFEAEQALFKSDTITANHREGGT